MPSPDATAEKEMLQLGAVPIKYTDVQPVPQAIGNQNQNPNAGGQFRKIKSVEDAREAGRVAGKRLMAIFGR